MTPYGVSLILNEELTKHQLKNVPPQMLYNYVRNGILPSTTKNGKIDVPDEVALTFVSWFVGKRLSKKS